MTRGQQDEMRSGFEEIRLRQDALDERLDRSVKAIGAELKAIEAGLEMAVNSIDSLLEGLADLGISIRELDKKLDKELGDHKTATALLDALPDAHPKTP